MVHRAVDAPPASLADGANEDRMGGIRRTPFRMLAYGVPFA
jgi:hypothetical protein